MKNFQCEKEFLLLFSQFSIDSINHKKVNDLIPDNINWKYLIHNSIQHRVMPLLYRNLKKIPSDAIPSDTLKLFQSLYLNNAVRNIRFSDTLKKILMLFNSHDLSAIPFKGPVLSDLIYGDASLRQFDDLDILVHKKDVIRVINLLETHGFRPTIKLNNNQYSAFIKYENSINLIHKDSNIPLEIHWELLGIYSSFQITMETLEERLEQIRYEDMMIYHFSREDLLLYICLHASKHSWTNLDYICCISTLIKKYPEMDWQLLLTLSQKMHCERIFFVGLNLALKLFSTPIPEELHKKISTDPRITNLTETICQRNFYFDKQQNQNFLSLRYTNLHSKIRERFSDQIKYRLKLFFYPTEKEWTWLLLPAWLSFTYYLLRPIRLIVVFIRYKIFPSQMEKGRIKNRITSTIA